MEFIHAQFNFSDLKIFANSREKIERFQSFTWILNIFSPGFRKNFQNNVCLRVNDYLYYAHSKEINIHWFSLT